MTKRATKAQKLAAEAKRLAELLDGGGGAVTTAPGLLDDPRLAVALQAWNTLAPKLRDLGTLDELNRFNLTMYCCYRAEFVFATDDLLKHGYVKRVRTVSGDYMIRANPAKETRDGAFRAMLELGKHLGLSRLDRLGLRQRPGMLGDAGPLFDNANVVDVEPVIEPPAPDERTRRWLELAKPASKEPS